jgi:hypothetical protein
MVGAGLSRGIGAIEAQKSPDPVLHNPDPMSTATTLPGTMPSDDISGLPPGPVNPRMNRERAKAFNEERHKRLEDDAAKLQALTNELKADVDKADKDELSLVVMRKAAEIEKLAHDVQSRMKN